MDIGIASAYVISVIVNTNVILGNRLPDPTNIIRNTAIFRLIAMAVWKNEWLHKLAGGVASERRAQYVLDGYAITVEIPRQRCTDAMSGEKFEVSVSVIMPDRRLEGCGRALF